MQGPHFAGLKELITLETQQLTTPLQKKKKNTNNVGLSENLRNINSKNSLRFCPELTQVVPEMHFLAGCAVS